MRTEETMAAEKIRRNGQPVIAGQEFLRSDDGIQHALCFYDPAYAKRVRELRRKTD